MTKAPPVVVRVYRGAALESSHRGSRRPWSTSDRLLARDAATRRAPVPSAPPRSRSRRSRCSRPAGKEVSSGKRRDRADVRLARRRAATRAARRRMLARGGFQRNGPRRAARTRRCTSRRRAPSFAAASADQRLAQQLLRASTPACCSPAGCSVFRAKGYCDPRTRCSGKIRTPGGPTTAASRRIEIPIAVDGCNLPVFRLPLSALALGLRAPGRQRACRERHAPAAAAAGAASSGR